MDQPARDDLLPIGRFARLSGLSIGALRHYDELDLLRPARIDPETGYRSYRWTQLDPARTIARLRELELPLDSIREVLATDDPERRATILATHRARVEARTHRLQRVLHHLAQLTRRKEPTMSTPPGRPEVDDATRRSLAVGLFNHVWSLLETADRTPAQDDELVHAAHASRYHWGEVGDASNLAIGEWQVSRVYATLGRGEPALHHARRCLAIVEGHGLGGWRLASAYEALARASAVAGDRDAATRWKSLAEQALEAVDEADDREIVEQDIATLPV
ncbi:MAG TPA: helix-turn-helix domain-containing protein [Candidatus Limnocylindrales bacterium]|jgi:DNA-binding transcriptional MerR regulator